MYKLDYPKGKSRNENAEKIEELVEKVNEIIDKLNELEKE